MCRWLAYSGSPILLEDLLFKPDNSLVVQSKHSRLGAESVNGDGFGIGWYGARGTPGRYRSTEPAWNDLNLRELSAQVLSDRIFAHVRATTGSPVQQTNCHPFRHGRWLWMHNRGDRGVPGGQARPEHGGRPGALPAGPGLDGLGVLLLPRPHLRAGVRPAHRSPRWRAPWG
ncbi:class II glutamine amidotransferase [Nocardioides houyundeii]|uniref:class II glutamine amidotransferase n=1 Tax=Nocardioides houyundeii TaxID=2045452 RepID=UPI00196306D7|nr:class II glutamine amidotransferase [Nocardioides houyundeii]